MSLLCSLRHIHLNFGLRGIFKNAELSINKGDKIGLIGLNGQGKSTLFHILTGSITPDNSTPAFIFDKNSDEFKPFLIPQELDTQTHPDLIISEYYLTFYPRLLDFYQKGDLETFDNLGGWKIEESFTSYLKSFGLNDFSKKMTELSGGERRKVALSIGLSSKSNFLLWDEPTNHLDVETIEKFEDLLKKLNKTMMIISHDRYFLNHTTNRMVHIERGEITSFDGTYLEYLDYQEEKEKELAKNLSTAQNKQRRELAWMRQGIKARGTRSKKRVEGFHALNDTIQKIKDKRKKQLEMELVHSGRKSKQLVQFEEMKFSYENKDVFNGVDLTVFRGDKIALIGENGAGKTTLIKLITEEIKIGSGKRKSLDDLEIGYFQQQRDILPMDSTLVEFIGEGSDFVVLPNGHKKHVVSYLEGFLFNKEQITRPIHTLSGGEKNRLQLAHFLRRSADLFIFDEPTNDLDLETIEILESKLKAYDAAVIIISHDRAFLDAICQKTWLIEDKKVQVFTGGYTQVADYIQAMQMKKNQEAKPQNSKKPEVIKVAESKPEEKVETKKKPTNKDKMDWKTIDVDIERMEAKVEELNEAVASFDFSKMSQDLNTEFERLNQEKNQAEEDLLNLMERWEYLTEIFS